MWPHWRFLSYKCWQDQNLCQGQKIKLVTSKVITTGFQLFFYFHFPIFLFVCPSACPFLPSFPPSVSFRFIFQPFPSLPSLSPSFPFFPLHPLSCLYLLSCVFSRLLYCIISFIPPPTASLLLSQPLTKNQWYSPPGRFPWQRHCSLRARWRGLRHCRMFRLRDNRH